MFDLHIDLESEDMAKRFVAAFNACHSCDWHCYKSLKSAVIELREPMDDGYARILGMAGKWVDETIAAIKQ